MALNAHSSLSMISLEYLNINWIIKNFAEESGNNQVSIC